MMSKAPFWKMITRIGYRKNWFGIILAPSRKYSEYFVIIFLTVSIIAENTLLQEEAPSLHDKKINGGNYSNDTVYDYCYYLSLLLFYSV